MVSRRGLVVLVDDLRSFVDGRPAEVVRSSAAAVELLGRLRGERIDELWLDHDLGGAEGGGGADGTGGAGREGGAGGADTVWPVVEMLERAAFEERPFDIGVVHVHSSNPPGAAKVVQALRRWGYEVRLATGSPAVGYTGE
ncbi:cyclic-phosphate processing receiver domain-containing protein [Dactylosporangium sp. AC04546]|uniref:cyclic-phosphate processing receiver domain-containing protein n=1 Tax=Dactylosporangium sp. AC04546 TaxID=2862460 RepID=UPI002E7B579A|nr:cyclic-phosphate processing receiver domain-containing protein [Dactylosporangium sp. AC04546]WVK89436.1 cyclic-phosphate processing receiver domain-containing protein [Dactylosporangium sp. AC04546]